MTPHVLIIISLIAVALYAVYCDEKREKDLKNKSEFDQKYLKIQKMISTYPSVPGNHRIIYNELDQLIKLKSNNSSASWEKTEILCKEFYEKFPIDSINQSKK